MARGNGKGAAKAQSAAMPKFVDCKLSQDDKAEFLQTNYSDEVLLQALRRLCDDGYRVGCSWSGEQQAYVVSLTCRNSDSANNGLCMTSFARFLNTAVALAVFKHEVITKGNWLGDAGPGSEDFG